MRMKSKIREVIDEMNAELAIPLTAEEKKEGEAYLAEERALAEKLDREIADVKALADAEYDRAFESKNWAAYDQLDARLDELKAQRKKLIF